LLLILAALLLKVAGFVGCGQPYDPANPGGIPPEHPVPMRALVTKAVMPEDISRQTQAQADTKSAGCESSNCHAGIEEIHTDGLPIGCVDCHGGNATATTKDAAHVHPVYAEDWPKTGQLPVRSYSMLNDESPEFVRFVNPGDLRAARLSCGGKSCHAEEVEHVRKSMMATAPMLWEAALYNNGEYPWKFARYGEAYSENGNPTRVQTLPPPSAEETQQHDVLPYLDPQPRFEITQPGNVLRVFERGENRLSTRGYGTKVRTDPVYQGLQRTRLLDPTLWFLGTSDHSGDYRSSGCSACHIIYANDRDESHSMQYAQYGNEGHSYSKDGAISKDVSGFPIRHQFTNSIPSSQCMVCHVHPGTNVLNSYYGTIWWDNESDGEHFYPKEPKKVSADQEAVDLMANPEAANVKGLWSDNKFLTSSSELNPKLAHVQIADFHGHGWIFRYAWKRDEAGNLLDKQGKVLPDNAYKWRRAVKLQDIHNEYGMQCADCHFEGDSHGNGKLYGEVRNAIQVRCEDCHGTYTKYADFLATGNAGTEDGKPINLTRNDQTKKTAFGNRLRERRKAGGVIEVEQQSTMRRDLKWPVPQLATLDNPNSKAWNRAYEAAAYAHTIQKDGRAWGKINVSDEELAHPLKDMACQTCHSSWVPSCFGCHLPMKANMRRQILHYDGDMTRNWTSYDFQTLREDVFMIGRDGITTGNRISPARSSCAVLVSSYNPERAVIYTQQQTVSTEGFSGQSFSTTVPHTVRGTETKRCTDCHVSENNDNNAKLAQLLMQGTNFVNFMGRYCWVAEGNEGMEAVVVTERDEPQAVIGSHLHELACPNEFKKFVKGGRILHDAFEHASSLQVAWKGNLPEFHAEVRTIQNRGEYLFTAQGKAGFVVYDTANLDNKDFAERFSTAPVSPIGQRTYVSTRDATAVLLPTTLLIDPTRSRRPENLEQKVPMEAAYAFVTDRYEGLVAVNVGTLGDGNPDNNFFERGPGFNPSGMLDGAIGGTIAGNYAYVLCERGIVVVDVSNPEHPRVVGRTEGIGSVKPREIAIQFRYGFLVDSQGLKVVDVTSPTSPRVVESASVPISEARNIYVARTYAYVSAGAQGLVIVDIRQPEHPKIDQVFNADGQINDLNDTKLAMTDASVYAYLADGKNGLRVVQLISPDDAPGYEGFSPRPTPKLIATYHTHGPALAIPKGLDRDRAVDESGNQLSVFGRRGARPLTLPEMQKLYLRNGKLYTVSDTSPKR
jgi:hypothetical protein